MPTAMQGKKKIFASFVNKAQYTYYYGDTAVLIELPSSKKKR